MARRRRSAGRTDRPNLTAGGIRVGSEVVPLCAASVHYWRLERNAWRPALDAVKTLGFRLIDSYVPWSVHELPSGELDFGATDPRRDAASFFRLAHELGLLAIVRPGPHINAELTGFGLPERVLWDEDCQARSARGNPVLLPVPPLAFPVPSYASDAFASEVERWFAAVGAELGELCWPNGPIVIVQIDNEGAMYFRDGVYDQDYHPDSLRGFRRFVQKKHGRVDALRAAYQQPDATFAKLEPPRELDATTPAELARHLDWAEWQEQLLADAFSRMKRALDAAGFSDVVTSHNLPLGEGATPLDPERLGQAVDLIGLDYYHAASPPQRAAIARRTSELATRSTQRNHPAFACELGAGFPPFFPPLSERDNEFTTLTALAYGLRGFNVYMAVDRDRWVGAPISREGVRRPSSRFWQDLLSTLERTRFAELQRRVDVCIVVPRSLRRLARVCHAFGPLSAALFQVLGGGAEEACLEDDFGLGSSLPIDAERFVRKLEHELDRARISYAFVGGDLLDWALSNARWTVLVSSGALEAEIIARAQAALDRGQPLTLGPHPPTRDALLRLLEPPPSLRTSPSSEAPVPELVGLDPAAIEAAVHSACEAFQLRGLAVDPESVFASLHTDAEGRPRVLFVMNPADQDVDVSVTSAGAATARDALSGEQHRADGGWLSFRMLRQTVVMLELLDDS